MRISNGENGFRKQAFTTPKTKALSLISTEFKNSLKFTFAASEAVFTQIHLANSHTASSPFDKTSSCKGLNPNKKLLWVFRKNLLPLPLS